MRGDRFAITETQVNKSASVVDDGYSLNLTFRIPHKVTHAEVLQELSAKAGVFLVEELE